MIKEGIKQRKHETTTDSMLSDLSSFQDFFYRNFSKNYSPNLDYSHIHPVSNQPARLYATAKTHKFEDHSQITTDNLKLRPIISTCGTYFYETAKALSKYLVPLAENQHTINNTMDFAEKLKDQTNEIAFSYDVTSLFTQIPLVKTINHILDPIYKQYKLPQIASQTIFKCLLERVTKGTVFSCSFNGKLYKQVDGCGTGNLLSPTLANIFMCKLEEDMVTPHNLPFYDRYVDDCFYTKRKTNTPDNLLEKLNSYHPNIKFTVEDNPDHFLDTSFNHPEGNVTTRVYQKPGKLQVHWKSAIPERSPTLF